MHPAKNAQHGGVHDGHLQRLQRDGGGIGRGSERFRPLPDLQLLRTQGGVNGQTAAFLQSLGHRLQLEQRGVQDHDEIGLVHLALDAYLPAVDAGERLNRSASPLRPEVGERLGMEAGPYGRVGQGLGGHDRPLPSPAVEPDLIHAGTCLRGAPICKWVLS